MISLTCTSCKKTLEIDDAFAGGVCRCQYCGTIQTVPASLKKGGRPGAPVGTAAASQKTLYQRKTRRAPGDAASGEPPEIGRAARAAQPEGTAAATATAATRKTWLVGIALGGAAALLIALLAWIVM